jgi:hypothetical protein
MIDSPAYTNNSISKANPDGTSIGGEVGGNQNQYHSRQHMRILRSG